MYVPTVKDTEMVAEYLGHALADDGIAVRTYHGSMQIGTYTDGGGHGGQAGQQVGPTATTRNIVSVWLRTARQPK